MTIKYLESEYILEKQLSNLNLFLRHAYQFLFFLTLIAMNGFFSSAATPM